MNKKPFIGEEKAVEQFEMDEQALSFIREHIYSIQTRNNVPSYFTSNTSVDSLIEALNAVKVMVEERINVNFGCGKYGVRMTPSAYDIAMIYFADYKKYASAVLEKTPIIDRIVEILSDTNYIS